MPAAVNVAWNALAAPGTNNAAISGSDPDDPTRHSRMDRTERFHLIDRMLVQRKLVTKREFLDELDAQFQDDIITVVIPEFVTSWSTQWLHNGSAFALKAKLLHRPHTAVVSVPIHMHHGVVEEV